MIVLKIIGIVFSALFLIIALILCVRVDIIIRRNKEDGSKVLVRVLGIVFGKEKKDKPKKKKQRKQAPKKEKEQEENILISSLKRLFGLNHFDELGGTKEKDSLSDVIDSIKETAEAVSLIINKLFWAIKHCRLRKLHLISVSGGEDAAKAAMDYGTACSVLYPMLGLMQSNMKINPKNLHIEIRCDFEREESEFSLDTEISLRVFYVFAALMKIIAKNLLKEND